MISLWEQMRQGDGRAVQRALREADLIWRSGERLSQAVLWVERAAAFAQAVGDVDRASELASYAFELGREVERRSGMPARSDPAWEEARRMQSSLIDVRDSWLDPVELKEEVRAPTVTLPDDDLEALDQAWSTETAPMEDEPLPDIGISQRGREMAAVQDLWFEEAPTLPRIVLPPSERDTIRPPLGSFNDVVLLELEHSLGPDVIVERPALTEELDPTSLAGVRAMLRGCPEFEDTPEEKLDALLSEGSLLHLNNRAAVAGWDAGLVLDGEVGLLRRAAVSVRIGKGASFSCSGSVPSVAAQMAATQSNTRVVAWDRAALESVLGTCPWVLESLRNRADRLLTLGVIALGSVARHMGEPFVESFLDASQVVVLAPHTVLFEPSTEVHALNIVGIGEIEIVDDKGEIQRAQHGHLLFPRQLVAGAPAPKTARAGAFGATVLHLKAIELPGFLPQVPLLMRALAG